MNADKQEIDAQLIALLEAGESHAAIELLLATYGTAIFGMFIGVFDEKATAQDTYQHFCITLWESLPSFQGNSAVYTWAYVIARRSISWKINRPEHRREQRLHTHQEQELFAQQWSRTATAEWHKTETKSRFRELCQDLPHNERLLVMLRIGQKMNWKEIAQVIHEGDEPLEDKGLSRASAAARKRFERVKEKLRLAMARE